MHRIMVLCMLVTRSCNMNKNIYIVRKYSVCIDYLSYKQINCYFNFAWMTYRVVTHAVVWSGTSWMLSGGLCYGGVSGSGACVMVGVGGVRLMNWNCGFSSATHCSLINKCCLWYICIYTFSVMFMCQPFLHVFYQLHTILYWSIFMFVI
jgi:hypothetical protein